MGYPSGFSAIILGQPSLHSAKDVSCTGAVLISSLAVRKPSRLFELSSQGSSSQPPLLLPALWKATFTSLLMMETWFTLSPALPGVLTLRP